MSRIGKLPINIPQGVEASLEANSIKIKGPKGELTQEVRPEIKVEIKDDEIATSISKDTKESDAYWGTTRSLISNMVKGVTDGYNKRLSLVGVGYRAKSSDDGISLSLGFSHPIDFSKPEGIELLVEDNTTIVVSGIDKQLVGQTAAKIRSLRSPEPYKGKGIRYEGEPVKIKPGKAGKI